MPIKTISTIFFYGFALLFFINESRDNIAPYMKGEININIVSVLIIIFILFAFGKLIIQKLDNLYAVSSLFLVIITIPAIIIHILIRELKFETVIFIFISLIPLILLKIASRSRLTLREHEKQIIPSLLIVVLTALALNILFVSLTYKSFYLSSFDKVYDQRFRNSVSGIMGYMQLYAGFVFPSIVLTIGLFKKNYFYIIFSLGSFIYFYGIMAHKSTLFSIVMIVCFYWISRKKHINNVNFILFILAGIIIGITILSKVLINELILNWMKFVIIRSILMPAISYIDYQEAANALGFTYMQNISLIHDLYPVSTIYESMIGWPSLDHVLGNYYEFGETTGYNAGLVPSAYIMGGILGVTICSAILVIYLAAIENVTTHIDKGFKLTLMAPFLYTLINIPFHTFLISFGGLLILIIFFIVIHKSYKLNYKI